MVQLIKLEIYFPQITLMSADYTSVICENLPTGRQVCKINGKEKWNNSGIMLISYQAITFSDF
jgi:hypothetical protein